ncbi:MAG: biotin/lipoyl-containing protein, partial [Pseudomonadota bacterium]
RSTGAICAPGRPSSGLAPFSTLACRASGNPPGGRPGAQLALVDLEAERDRVSDALDRIEIDDEDLNAYLMYPKVFTDYARRHIEYGPVRALPTRAFFYGMDPGEEVEAEIDPGKTLVIRLQAIGETDEEGDVRVFFELNGQPRVVRVPDRRVKATRQQRPKAEEGNPAHLAAPMPGIVASVAVSVGQAVAAGDLVLTIEAMKMETALHADRAGVVTAVHAPAGAQVDAKDLLVEFEP